MFLAKSVQAKGFPFSVAPESDTQPQEASLSKTQHKISSAGITGTMHDLAEHFLPLSATENLTQLTYCHNTFGLSFPVLKLAKSPPPEHIRSAAKEQNRYSTTKVTRQNDKTTLSAYTGSTDTATLFVAGKKSLATKRSTNSQGYNKQDANF